MLLSQRMPLSFWTKLAFIAFCCIHSTFQSDPNDELVLGISEESGEVSSGILLQAIEHRPGDTDQRRHESQEQEPDEMSLENDIGQEKQGTLSEWSLEKDPGQRELRAQELEKIRSRLETPITTVKISSNDEEFVMNCSGSHLAKKVDLLLGHGFPESAHQRLIPVLRNLGYQVQLEQYLSTGKTLLIAKSFRFLIGAFFLCRDFKKKSYKDELGSVDECRFTFESTLDEGDAFKFYLSILLPGEQEPDDIRQRLPLLQ
jgi:hypothetical protein